MKTYIRKIDGKWYAFAGHQNQVYSIGRDDPKEGGHWFASWTKQGVRYVSTASPNRRAAVAKAKRHGEYCGMA